MREIVVLAVADDEHGCGSSGGRGGEPRRAGGKLGDA